ncbi:MAG: prepilin-type cleavage/methylation domain-containing protein [Burkholderiales bacterium]
MRGFTLAEAVIVIVITGIIAAMVAVFVRGPVDAYFDVARRSQLSDTADTALRRISRDLRLALPNSVRVRSSGGATYLEFLITSGGGRYRARPPGDPVNFNISDSSFDVLGPMPSLPAGSSIVIYNLTSDSTIGSANAYFGDNRAAFVSAAGNVIDIAPTQFPFESPVARFQVVEYPVSYECAPASGVLRRHWGYSITSSQPPPFTGTDNTALLADGVSACGFTYDANAVARRAGVVSLSLTLTRDSESVALFQQVHVPNVP